MATLGMNTFGDLPTALAANLVVRMLAVGLPVEILGKYAMPYVIPDGSTKVARFSRYNPLALSGPLTPVVEGVTPPGQQATRTDIDITVQQYINWVGFTDMLELISDTPYLQQLTKRLGEQQMQVAEIIRYNAIKAGTNVQYANGAARTSVNTPFTRALQRVALRTIKRNNGEPFNEKISSTPDFRTEPVEQSYVGICHTDVENDIRNADGFISVKQYRSGNPNPGEIGAIEDCIYFKSTLFTPFADGGGAKAGASGTCISTTGTSADVYPIVYLAREAFGSVTLRGMYSTTIMLTNPKQSSSDPGAQRGVAAWKMAMAAGILHDGWLNRAEVGALA